MRRAKILIFGMAVMMNAFASGTAGVAQTRVTTLLPIQSESFPSREGGMLAISADDSKPIQTTSKAKLVFDLKGISQDVDAVITKATLRLVGKPGKYRNPQIVEIFPEPQPEPVGYWTAIYTAPSDPKAAPVFSFSASPTGLRDAVAAALKKEDPRLSLTLSSTSRLGDWLYYSTSAYADTSSFKPRLIIEYELAGTSAERKAWMNTERTHWKFFPPVIDVKGRPILGQLNLISNPVFYKGDMVVFGGGNTLYSLSSSGGERWKTTIKDVPASHALVADTGRLYSAGQGRIAIYDLERQGEASTNMPREGLVISVPPTLAADGSLYLIPSGSGYLYGFNPDLKELWRYPPGREDAPISPFVLSPDRQAYGYALIANDKKNEFVRINTADGSPEEQELCSCEQREVCSSEKGKFCQKFPGFHRPVVSRGPEQDYVLLSLYSGRKGVLYCYSGGEEKWKKQGPVSQPIVDQEGKRVLVIQGDRLRGYDLLNGNELCSTDAEIPLAATSNLVLDGGDRLYFWNNGTLYGYTSQCEPFLKQKISGLPKELELLFGPDGTLYARTEKPSLYALIPCTPCVADLAVDKTNLAGDTVYSAENIRVAGGLEVGEGMEIMLKAKDKISFGAEFKVKKGGSLTCKTGF